MFRHIIQPKNSINQERERKIQLTIKIQSHNSLLHSVITDDLQNSGQRGGWSLQTSRQLNVKRPQLMGEGIISSQNLRGVNLGWLKFG